MSQDTMIVHEVYEGNNTSHERFALELERCLEAQVSTIIIEPVALGVYNIFFKVY